MEIITLSGPQGNAFYLLGVAQKLCKQHNLNWEEVQQEMQSSDYDNLLKVFKKNFSEWVIVKD